LLLQSRLRVQYASFFPVSRVWQALLDRREPLERLADLVKEGHSWVSQLVIVPGLTDLAFDLYCSPDNTYEFMETYKKTDLEGIRRDVERTCGSKERFNACIKAFILAAAENFRDKVGVASSRCLQHQFRTASKFLYAQPLPDHVSLRHSPTMASAAQRQCPPGLVPLNSCPDTAAGRRRRRRRPPR
jgi:hypothetical protein